MGGICFNRSGSSRADPRTDAGNDRVNSTRDLTLSLSGCVTYFLAATDLHLELPAHVLGLLLVLFHLLLGLPHLLLEDIQEIAALHLSHVALSVFRTELTCVTQWSGWCSLGTVFRAWQQREQSSVSWPGLLATVEPQPRPGPPCPAHQQLSATLGLVTQNTIRKRSLQDVIIGENQVNKLVTRVGGKSGGYHLNDPQCGRSPLVTRPGDW